MVTYLFICLFLQFFCKNKLEADSQLPNLVAGITALCNEAGTKSSFKNVVFSFLIIILFLWY